MPMKTRSMLWIAIAMPIAVVATILAWVPGQAPLLSFALFGLAFIFCLGGLTAAVDRCAGALEKRN